MNKELLDKLQFQAAAQVNPLLKDREWQRVYNEKLAELIVLECEKVAKGGSWYYDAPSCGWRSPINHVCNEMKEHFGVEK